MSDPVPFRDAFPVAEFELDDLLEKLDIPINAKAPPCVLVLGLARQAGLVFAGLRREAREDDSGATPPILLRTLADAAILIRWIEEAPELHVDMYQAEDDRLRLAGAPAFEALRKTQGGEPGAVFPPDAEAELRAGIDATRARALAEKEPIGRAAFRTPEHRSHGQGHWGCRNAGGLRHHIQDCELLGPHRREVDNAPPL